MTSGTPNMPSTFSTSTIHVLILISSDAAGRSVSKQIAKGAASKDSLDSPQTIPGAQVRPVIVESATNKMYTQLDNVRIFSIRGSSLEWRWALALLLVLSSLFFYVFAVTATVNR